jgi:hypothetical protein
MANAGPRAPSPPRFRPYFPHSKFTPEEDVLLRTSVARLGTVDWDTVALSVPGRTARQCRERWKHYLSSSKSEKPWTPAEDQLLYERISAWGPKWTRVAGVLAGRTDIEVKTRWLKKFNRDLPMLPRSTRADFSPPSTAERAPLGSANDPHAHLRLEFISFANMEKGLAFPTPLDPPPPNSDP